MYTFAFTCRTIEYEAEWLKASVSEKFKCLVPCTKCEQNERKKLLSKEVSKNNWAIFKNQNKMTIFQSKNRSSRSVWILTKKNWNLLIALMFLKQDQILKLRSTQNERKLNSTKLVHKIVKSQFIFILKKVNWNSFYSLEIEIWRWHKFKRRKQSGVDNHILHINKTRCFKKA